MMRGASRAALEVASQRWETTLALTDGAILAEQVFGVVDALAGSGALRRNLTDPARPAADKQTLATTLLRGRVDDAVTDLVAFMAGQRWSAEADLGDALELLGIDAVLASASRHNRLTEVADDLFRFDRAVTATKALRAALADRTRSADDRARLAATVAQGAAPQALVLIDYVVRHAHATSVSNGLGHVMERAAARRRRRLAQVTSAVPLSQAQTERLADILTRAYGVDVTLNVGVDPAVIGGVRITIGSEVIDATMVAKLADANWRFRAATA